MEFWLLPKLRGLELAKTGNLVESTLETDGLIIGEPGLYENMQKGDTTGVEPASSVKATDAFTTKLSVLLHSSHN